MFNRVGFFLMWYTGKQYHCLPPSPFFLCTDEGFRPHLEKNIWKKTPAESLSPPDEPFHFYICNAKMFPTLLFIFDFAGPLVAWLALGEQRGCLWARTAVLLPWACCPTAAPLLLQHWVRALLLWENRRSCSNLCSVLTLLPFFLGSSSVNLTFASVKCALFSACI